MPQFQSQGRRIRQATFLKRKRMSFSFGGLIIKNAGVLTDGQVLEVAKNKRLRYDRDVSLHQAASRQLEGVGLLRWSDMAFVFDKDLPYACSFDSTKPTALDIRLGALSTQHESLCYLLNGTSESYAYAIYENGKMVRAKSVSSGEQLSDSGRETPVDQHIALDEAGMIHLFENFTGIPFTTFMGDGRMEVKVFQE